jgi:hypothetical protein
VGALAGAESRGRRAQHELQHLPSRIAHLEAAALLMHGEHDRRLEGASEVRDPRPSTDARNWSRGFEHQPILAARRAAGPTPGALEALPR